MTVREARGAEGEEMRMHLFMKAFVSLGLLCLVAVPVVHGGTIRSDRSDSLYTGLAAQPEFDSVGRFTWNEGQSSFLASGTLIRDNWVLTAAHVIDGTDGVGGGVENLRFDVGGRRYSAAEWIPHENWSLSGGESNLFAGWDIGLVRLSEDVTNVDPATLYTGREELGQTSTIVGFGATGTGATGAIGPSGTKRAGNNVVDAVGRSQTAGSDPRFRFGHDRLIAIDFDEPGDPFESTLGSAAPLDLEYLTAPGDSGGGLFIEIDGEQQLAGVTSLGSSLDNDGANSDYGDRASFTRVSSFLDWIESIIGPAPLEGDENGDGFVSAADFTLLRDLGLPISDFKARFGDGLPPAPAQLGVVTTVPEPTAVGLLLVGSLLAMPHRARRESS